MLNVFLTGQGSVVTATNGQEALETLKQYPDIKVVLLDIRLPDMGGIEVLRKIMAGKQHPEVIILTAVNDAQIAKLAFEVGAFDYCLKPFDMERLESLIIACAAHAEYRKHPA